MKHAIEFLSWIVIAFAVFMFVLSAGSSLNLFGGYRSYLIQSGSMEPSIMTGDIVLIQPSSSYGKNDVITFRSSQDRTVTHRIMDVKEGGEGPVFVTKGDANRAEDEDTVTPAQVIGRVILVIPKLGFMVAFAKSPGGMALLIGLPAFLLVSSELVGLVWKK